MGHPRFLRLSLVLLALATVACQGPTPTVNDTGDPGPARSEPAAEEAVIEAHEALVRAYETGDTDAFLSLLWPSADLMIFHPLVEDRFDGIEEARSEVGRMFGRLGGASWIEVHPALFVEGDVAWFTSHVLVEAPGVDHKFVGRGTEVWVRRDGIWLLAHGHWSEHPGIYAD